MFNLNGEDGIGLVWGGDRVKYTEMEQWCSSCVFCAKEYGNVNNGTHD